MRKGTAKLDSQHEVFKPSIIGNDVVIVCASPFGVYELSIVASRASRCKHSRHLCSGRNIGKPTQDQSLATTRLIRTVEDKE